MMMKRKGGMVRKYANGGTFFLKWLDNETLLKFKTMEENSELTMPASDTKQIFTFLAKVCLVFSDRTSLYKRVAK